MPNVKISALPAVTVPALTDTIPVVQAGVTKKATLSQYSAMGPIFTQVTAVSSADILNNFLNFEIIAAPGAGLVAIPIGGIFEYYFNSIAYTDALNITFNYKYAGAAGIAPMSGDIRSVLRNTVVNGARVLGPWNSGLGAVTITSACVNSAVQCVSTTTYAAGNGTGKFTMYYIKQAVSI